MMKVNEIIPTLWMSMLFLFVYFVSLLIVKPFKNAGMQAFENPENPMNIIYFIAILLVLTLVILTIAKYWKKKLIYMFILAAVAVTSMYVLDPIFVMFIAEPFAFYLSLVMTLLIVLALVYYPEWYVIDLCGILVAIGSIAIFGISLTIPLVIILLTILAIYDFISVYKTKHMITLADTVVDLKLPVLFIIPKKLPYSFRKEETSLKKKLDKGEERDAFFMGVGDVVIPGILVAACYNFIGDLMISFSVILGILVGFFVLMLLVIKGKPQPGLPFLNTGAIIAYFISSYVLHSSLVGFTFL